MENQVQSGSSGMHLRKIYFLTLVDPLRLIHPTTTADENRQ